MITILSTLILFILGVTAATATSSVATLPTKFLTPAIAAFHEQNFRNLVIDEDSQCVLDTDALYENPALETAYEAWEAELDSENLDDQACTPDGETFFECLLDSTKLSTHDAVVAACGQVNGKSYLQSGGVSCKITGDGVTAEFIIRFIELPLCLASSCDADETAELLDVAGQIEEDYEESLSFIFESVECNTLDSSLAYGLSPKASFGVTSVVAVISWFLL